MGRVGGDREGLGDVIPHLLVEMPASAGMTPATASFLRMQESPLMPA